MIQFKHLQLDHQFKYKYNFEEENIYHANTNTIWAKYEFVINFETNTIIFLTSSNNSDKTNIMP
jgi:hypothetical protein